MKSEEQDVRQILQGMAYGQDREGELVYDEDARTLRSAGPYADPDRTIRIKPQDLDHWS